MFRGGFLHFLHQWKQEKNTLSGNYKFCNFSTIVSIHYLRKFFETHTAAHFETNCQCFLMLNAINGKNESK